MKRIFYISLFILLCVMLTVSLYYVLIFAIVTNGVIHWSCLEYFLDSALSPMILGLITLLGISIGYRAGKRWWQIIYIDGVYYFHQARTGGVVGKRTSRKIANTAKKQKESV